MGRTDPREISGCGLAGMMSAQGQRVGGEAITRSIGLLHDRSNGLGGGFAAYGIYPDRPGDYAFHVMYYSHAARDQAEQMLDSRFSLTLMEPIPTRPVDGVCSPPDLVRYFVQPQHPQPDEQEYVMAAVMEVNSQVEGAYIFSSGRNMGAFKGVGYPEDISRFYRLEEYQGYLWTAHGRFPTNTPGWWAGAHPFTIMDWSVVHNGEISSYGANRRYLEMFGYHCTMRTDTEVIAYLMDLLVRRHGLGIEMAAQVLAAPFWREIDRAPESRRRLLTAIRQVYGPALVNGPFAIIVAHSRGMIGLNDRIKLRPLVAARKDDWLYLASEEAAIREICPRPELVWSPRAGEPVVGELITEPVELEAAA